MTCEPKKKKNCKHDTALVCDMKKKSIGCWRCNCASPNQILQLPTSRRRSSSHCHSFQVTALQEKTVFKKLPLYDSHGIWKQKKKKRKRKKRHITRQIGRPRMKQAAEGAIFFTLRWHLNPQLRSDRRLRRFNFCIICSFLPSCLRGTLLVRRHAAPQLKKKNVSSRNERWS